MIDETIAPLSFQKPLSRGDFPRTFAPAPRPDTVCDSSGTELEIGMAVASADKKSLGTVAELKPGRLLVRPRFGVPYWIPDVLVREVSPGQGAVLHLSRSSIQRYKEIRPESHIQLLFASAPARRCCGVGLATIGMLCLLSL